MTFYYPLRNLIQLQLFGKEVSYCNILKGRRTDFSMRQTYQRSNDRADINFNASETLLFFSWYLSLILFRSKRIKGINSVNKKSIMMATTMKTSNIFLLNRWLRKKCFSNVPERVGTALFPRTTWWRKGKQSTDKTNTVCVCAHLRMCVVVGSLTQNSITQYISQYIICAGWGPFLMTYILEQERPRKEGRPNNKQLTTRINHVLNDM